MISFTTEITIERPIDAVFAYVSNPLNFPQWNSAVEAVRRTSVDGGSGSTYAMYRELPTGRAVNELELIRRTPPWEFVLRTTSGPTPFRYGYRFAAANSGTLVRLDGEFELGGVAAVVPQLARRAVKKGVDENLATLKRTLEAGSLAG